jgi:alpha-D-ribose 1-methylphosphonate 5-triphosphate synthase subunit PhnG
MTQAQFIQTVELEQAWREEIEAREIERANEVLAEMRASRDEEFAASLVELFPMLRAWPGKTAK